MTLRLFQLLLSVALAVPALAQHREVRSPFFVFNNGLSDTAAYKTPEAQVALAKRVGFDGVEKNRLDNFPEFYQALKNNGLNLYTLYVQVNLDDEQNPYDRRLEETFKTIRGTDAMPWLFVTSQKLKPSSPEGDTRAVAILRDIADLAQRYGVRVMVYPHIWFWLQSPDDALRVLRQVARPNAGMTFNLCHYLATQFYEGQDPRRNFAAWAAKATPYVFALSVNGADFPPPSADRARLWDTLIQPLGSGRYDVYGFLKTFWDAGFQGPVGLQCYNVKQDKPTHLRQSVWTWNEYKRRYRAGK